MHSGFAREELSRIRGVRRLFVPGVGIIVPCGGVNFLRVLDRLFRAAIGWLSVSAHVGLLSAIQGKLNAVALQPLVLAII